LKLYIKHMVSIRCKMLVEDEMIKLGFHSFTVDLGEVQIKEDISPHLYDQIRQALEKAGFELLEDKKNILIERIKNAIIAIIHYSKDPLVHNLSAYLSAQLDYDYTYMSNLFSEKLGITIEKFYICHKIERVKELLIYDELTLTEIAFRLHYSSVAHLSNQFKKITGLTPSSFKNHPDPPKNRK
jgi:AraC-like DNA-binding protein